MPIYEYRCQECQQTFEEWQKDFTDRQVPCPVCGCKAERLISSSSFVLKGGGWYSDLYSKPSAKKAECCKKTESSPAETAPAAKPEAKPSADACAACSSGGCSN